MRLIARLAVLGGMLAALQLLFGMATDYKDTPSPVRLCDQYLAEGRDIIYFGDSTLFSVAPKDQDTAHIDQMVQRLLPEYRVGCISYGAFHMELYESFCTYIARRPTHPKLIVLPINLASVNPFWHMRPEYQFERMKLFLRHDSGVFRAFYRPLAAFGFFDLAPISQSEYEQTPVYDGDTPVGTMAQFMDVRYATFSEQNAKDQLVVRYMYRVPANHPKLQAMMRIAAIPSRTDIHVLFYLTPIDVESGERYLGPRFRARIRENAARIVDLLETRGQTPLDLTCDLPAETFCWGSLYPNEHLNEQGRMYVAERVATAIRERMAASRGEPEVHAGRPVRTDR